jgi:hypothetical protein
MQMGCPDSNQLQALSPGVAALAGGAALVAVGARRERTLRVSALLRPGATRVSCSVSF